MRRLLFLRHGVRQLHLHSLTPPLSSDSHCALLLAANENLNLNGHTLSYKMGKSVRKLYGKPDFLYGDITDLRTIDTSISFGRGAKITTAHFANTSTDLYFNPSLNITPNSILESENLIVKYNSYIHKVKRTMEDILPCLNLTDTSFMNTNNGQANGLVDQEYVLSSTMLFAEASRIPDPLLKKRKEISNIQPIYWIIEHPNIDVISSAATTLLGGISKFIQEYEFSVLIGHHHDINIMAQYLGKVFQVPNFPIYWVPENSGFVFTLHDETLCIEIIYFNRDLKVKVISYLQIRLPEANGTFDLISRRINYLC